MIDLYPQTPVELDYTPRGGALELMECRAMRVLMDGPAGTGKTRAILEKVHALCGKYPGSRHWIGRETRESMTESVLVTLETKVMWPGHPALETGGQRSQRQAYKFPNGSTIVVGGLDKPEKTFSAEYDTCSVFESVECSANDLELLLRTLRNGVMPYQQQILDTNPGPFTHHLNQSCNAGTIHRILSRHEDNPLLWDGDWTAEGRKYIGILDSLTGARRERLRFGRWVNAEGVVYDGFDAAVHVIDAMPAGWESWTKYRSIDFGFTNPFVCQWWAVDPDGRMYLYREIYRTQRTVRDHAQEIKRLSQGENIRETVTDHDAEDRATLRQEGIESIGARKDIRPGLDAVSMRLRRAGDGGGTQERPRLFVLRGALVERDPHLAERKAPLCTADEFDCYMWRKGRDGAPVKEEPEKVNDHGCFVAGTLIATERGFLPIEMVRPGDLVATRQGWKPVERWAMTNAAAKVTTVEFSNGWRLTGTANHPVFVDGIGFVPIDELRYGDIIQTWESLKSWCSAVSSSVGIPPRSNGQNECTSFPESPIDSGASDGCTKRYGSGSTAQSLAGGMSTTRTETRSTIESPTWNAYRRRHTLSVTENLQRLQALQGSRMWLAFGRLRHYGIEHHRDATGTLPTPSGSGRASGRYGWNVFRAESDSRARSDTPSTARLPVRRGLDGQWERMSSSENAQPAASDSLATDTSSSERVPVSVVHACARTATRPVFNLTVADAAEYYANGVLVHNCDAMRYMVMHLDSRASYGFEYAHKRADPLPSQVQVKVQSPKAVSRIAERNRRWDAGL